MGQSNAFLVNCGGGLDLTSTTLELAQKPGWATELINYESSPDGGYRRINGYVKIGEESATQASGYDDEVKGVTPYADGIIVVSDDDNIYFTTDGISFLLLSYDTGGYDIAEDSLEYETPLSRSNTGRVQSVVYEGNTLYGEVVICDGSNRAVYIKAIGSGVSRTWNVQEIDGSGAPTAPQWCEIHGERLILSGSSDAIDSVYYTNLYDITLFDSGGVIQTGYLVTGLKEWRERLFIFGRNNIQELVGINSTSAMVSVSNNVGTLTGFSIQEVGGDLVYLSIDGLRTLAGTQRIDDLELGSISVKIQPLLRPLVKNFTNLDISSVVIRNKNQYRIFFCDAANTGNINRGVIGTYKMGEEGMLRWEWSEIKSIPISCINSSVLSTLSTSISSEKEIIVHGGYDGYIYLHDTGNDFDGDKINASYVSPEIDYGDWGIRKTLHWVRYSMTVDGSNADARLNIVYDFDSEDIAQPATFTLPSINGGSVYGTAIYGTSTYGGNPNIEERVLVNGGGFSNKFKWWSNSKSAPYSIKNFYVRFYGGKVL